MSIDYIRPKQLDEALNLLERQTPRTVPMGGGTTFGQYTGDPITVVDLQGLHLDEISVDHEVVTIGAMAAISALEKNANVPEQIRSAAGKELNENLRNSATVGGVIFSGSPRSLLSVVLNAVEANLVWLPDKNSITYGEFLAQKPFWKSGRLIEAITVSNVVKVGYEFISRTPDDVAFMIIAYAKWPSGRIRVILGGTGASQIVVADGKGTDGVEAGVINACSHSGDHWASSEYRSEIGKILFQRLHEKLQAEK